MNLLILCYVLCRHYVMCTAVASDAGDKQKKHVLTAAFLPVPFFRVSQKKKSSSLEDLQSESLEKVGLFVFTASGV